MRRKLVQQAKQAITITLPIEWIRNHNLQAGNEVDVTYNNNNLTISAQSKKKEQSITISLRGIPTRIGYNYINAAYAKGIDQIIIESDTQYYPNLHQNIGYAVTTQTDDSITIRHISGEANEDVDTIFKRVFQLIIGFYNTAIDAIFGDNTFTVETISKKDQEINAFILFLQRTIMKSTYANNSVLFCYSYALEKIGDDIFRLWRTTLQHPIQRNSHIKSLLEHSKNLLEKSFTAYYNTAGDHFKTMKGWRNNLREEIFEIIHHDTNTAMALMYALRIAEDAYDLKHLSLMKTL